MSEIKKFIETKSPRELKIDASKHTFYEDLKKGKYLPELKGYDMAILFAIAFAYGVYNKKRKSLGSSVKASITRTALDKNCEWLIKAVAINEEGVDVIADEKRMYEIAEEYANAGIDMIQKIIKGTDPGFFQKTMEIELSKIIKSMK